MKLQRVEDHPADTPVMLTFQATTTLLREVVGPVMLSSPLEQDFNGGG